MTDHRHLIAILRGIRADEIVAACEALVDAGIGLIEIPLNSPNPLISVSRAVSRFAGQADIGAGTVLTCVEVDELKAAGGTFVVSPNCDTEVIAHTREVGLASYPGVFTPSEAFAAIKAGATGLKFFPAGNLGPTGIAAMKAVLPPDMPVYAVGGAGPDNFGDFFEAGCVGFGLGSYLYKPGFTPDEIGERARKAVVAYDEWGSK